MSKNPYLLPNFHSVCDNKYLLSSSNNRFAFSSQIDFNGCGLRNGDICAKNNGIANFYALSPTLPYFVNKSRLQNNFAAKNCLIFCKNEEQNLLITTEGKKIFGLLIENTKVTNNESIADIQTKSHIYSADQTVSYGPFRYCTQKLYDLFVDENDEDFRPIFELKVHCDDQNVPQIQSNSRNKIRFFRFNCDQPLDLCFNQINELNIEDFRRTDDLLFENCDRNQLIDNQLLVSFTTNDVIDLYDLETNQTIRSFELEKKCKQIGLKWAESHPKKFFAGDHKRLQYWDSRSHKTVLEFFNKNNYNSFDWEMFYEFLPSKLNPNEVFLATDYHILIVDWRYHKKSLIQLNHLIPQNIIRCLKSLEVVVDNVNTELLVSSNFRRNCLMSFTSSLNLVPLSSNHLPIHLSNPKDIDKRFENNFYRGIELINSTDSSGCSLALLTNSNDIFIQDLFWCTSDEDMINNESELNYKDRTYSSGVGSSNLKLDPKVDDYMNAINKFLYDSDYETQVEAIYEKNCPDCILHRVCRIYSIESGECLCKNSCQLTKKPDINGHRNDTNRSAFILNLFRKQLGPQIWTNNQRLEDKEVLTKSCDKYTKQIFKIWNVFEEEPMDETNSEQNTQLLKDIE